MSIRKLRTPEFQLIYDTGRKTTSRSFIAFYVPHETLGYGVVASRKTIGNAVARNRAKRRLRALLQMGVKERSLVTGSFVLVARAAIMQSEFIDLQSEFLTCLKKLSLR